MAEKNKKEGLRVGDVVDKIFVGITLLFLGLTGLCVIYYTVLILGSAPFSILSLIPTVFSILFFFDIILFIKRKKSFINVSMFLICAVLIGAFFMKIVTYISGLYLSYSLISISGIIIFIVIPSGVSVITLIFSKTIKKYLRII